MENPHLKWMIWGYPYFRKPPYVYIYEAHTPTAMTHDKTIQKQQPQSFGYAGMCTSFRALIVQVGQIPKSQCSAAFSIAFAPCLEY